MSTDTIHARTHDPDTSHEAVPGNISQQMKHVLRAYADGAELTDHAAYSKVGLTVAINGARQRCSDLRRVGLIERTGERGMTPSGKSGYLCRITQKGRDFLAGRLPVAEAAAGPVSEAFLDGFEKFGPVARSLAQLIRPAIVAAEGKTFVWGDWSNIEARINPFLANSRRSDEKLRLFRLADAEPLRPDIYTTTAADLLGIHPAEVSRAQRQSHGKVPELALGFGGGVGALQNMATTYGVYMDDRMAQDMVDRWRAANSWAQKFWWELWDAVQAAIEIKGSIQKAGRVSYHFREDYLGGSLFCKLPDGRFLTYPQCRWELVQDDADEDGVIPEPRWRIGYRKGHGRAQMWHGKLCENIVQATAGSLLRDKLARLAQPDTLIPVVAHTHDEIVVECDEGHAEAAKIALQLIMTQPEAWCKDLPLKADVKSNWWLTKADD